MPLQVEPIAFLHEQPQQNNLLRFERFLCDNNFDVRESFSGVAESSKPVSSRVGYRRVFDGQTGNMKKSYLNICRLALVSEALSLKIFMK